VTDAIELVDSLTDHPLDSDAKSQRFGLRDVPDAVSVSDPSVAVRLPTVAGGELVPEPVSVIEPSVAVSEPVVTGGVLVPLPVSVRLPSVAVSEPVVVSDG